MGRTFRHTAVTFVLATVVTALSAQTPQRQLTVDAIYHPERRVDFSGVPAPDLTWLDDETYVTTRGGGRGVEWIRVAADSGSAAPLFDPAQMEAALASVQGVSRDEAARLARSTDLTFDTGRAGVLLTIVDDLYYYDIARRRASRLTTAAGVEEEATFSPDGRWVAFVRANNLFVVDIASRRERAITRDGSAEILNGKLDWLYQEEIYGRGRFRAYWWSPDSTSLAFLQLNERPVPEYTVVNHLPYRPELEVTDYPKAGDPNPGVKLGIGRVAGGDPRWVDAAAYAKTDFLIVNVDWTPDSKQVIHQVQDREQTWLDLNLADASSGRARRLLRETTKAWVNENGNPVWLKDGSFLWLSERSGFKHLYQFKTDGTLVRQVTTGRWDVRSLYGVDERNGLVYFPSSERSAIGTDVYRIKLDGTGMTRL